jgi:hypothetical protein
LKRHAALVLAFVLTLAGFTWLVTYGTWDLWDKESYGDYFDAQAASLLEGRLDVPEEIVGSESFTYQGKHYGYWGITPALLRLPLAGWCPTMAGRWSRTSLLLACLLTLLASCDILRTLQRFGGTPSAARTAASCFFILLVGLGSTLTFLAGRSFAYHEAAIWSSALGLAYYAVILRYLRRPRLLTLVGAFLCSLLCVLARATVGLGPIVTSSLIAGVLLLLWLRGLRGAGAELWWDRARRWLGVAAVSRPFTHAAVLVVSVALSLGSYVACNYLRFGTLFDGVPLRYYRQYIEHPEILEHIGGQLLSLSNFSINASCWLGKSGLARHPTFPWVKMDFLGGAILSGTGQERHMGAEPFASLPTCMPVFCILALLGAAALVLGRPAGARAVLFPAFGALAGGFYLFFMYYVTQRYAHDLFPLVVLLAALGLHGMLCWRRPVLRWAPLLALAPLALAGLYINCACTLFYQREQIWGVPNERKVAFRAMARQIQGFLDAGPNKEKLLAAAYTCLHPYGKKVPPAEDPDRDPVLHARLLVPGPAARGSGGWQTLLDNAEAARPDSPWQKRHPGAAPPPAQLNHCTVFPFRTVPSRQRFVVATFLPERGGCYLLTLPVQTQNYSGRLICEGEYFSRIVALPTDTSNTVLHIPLRVSEPETRQIVIWLEGKRLVPEAPATVSGGLPTLTRLRADDLPIQVCPGLLYRAHVQADRACFLETHHRFVTGYRAYVNGTRVEVARSPDHRLLVPLEAGDNEVTVRFGGSNELRLILFGLPILGVALLAGLGLGLWRRLGRRPELPPAQ